MLLATSKQLDTKYRFLFVKASSHCINRRRPMTTVTRLSTVTLIRQNPTKCLMAWCEVAWKVLRRKTLPKWFWAKTKFKEYNNSRNNVPLITWHFAKLIIMQVLNNDLSSNSISGWNNCCGNKENTLQYYKNWCLPPQYFCKSLLIKALFHKLMSCLARQHF